MEIVEFWRLIEAAKLASDGGCEPQAKILQALLSDLSPEQIVVFDRLLMAFHGRAYRWDLWGAAYLINGGCSDDGFFYFRAWLIGQGEAAYESALKDPDTLADVEIDDDDDAECEDLLYVSGQAYEEKTGTEMPPIEYEYPELIGERWIEDALESLYPQLSARYESAPVEETDSEHAE